MSSAIIPTNRGGTCTICWEDFKPEDEQFTHEGGEGHDGLHRDCLVRWLRTGNGTCPVSCLSPISDSRGVLFRAGEVWRLRMEELLQGLQSVPRHVLYTVVSGALPTAVAWIAARSVRDMIIDLARVATVPVGVSVGIIVGYALGFLVDIIMEKLGIDGFLLDRGIDLRIRYASCLGVVAAAISGAWDGAPYPFGHSFLSDLSTLPIEEVGKAAIIAFLVWVLFGCVMMRAGLL